MYSKHHILTGKCSLFLVRAILLPVYLFLLGSTVSAQEFQFKPDPFLQRLSSRAMAEANPIPAGGGPDTYNDALPRTEHIWWSNMQSNSNWNTKYKFKSITNVIRVGINHDTALITQDYTYRINLRIKGYKNPANPSAATQKDISIVLSYKKDSLQQYNDQIAFKVDDTFHAMDVIVTGILNNSTMQPIARSALAKNFFIVSEVSVQRYVIQVQKLFINSDTSQTATNNLLKVAWQHYDTTMLSFACGHMPVSDDYKPVKYELEWTYVDDYKIDGYAAGNPQYSFLPSSFSIAYNFRNNATRIQTYNNTFSIPVIYEHGALVFRIRTIRPDPANYGKYIYSAWNLPESGILTESSFTSGYSSSPYQCRSKCMYLIQQAFERDDFNWQYSINFAEEGKYKHILNYFDGAGHGRQMQTKINTDLDYIIAADKIYDYEGRPSIQTLPVPVMSQKLNYKPDLTLNKFSGLPYKAFDFDKNCRTGVIEPLHDSALANRYYSAANYDKSGFQKFVPDAEGYPFIETIYAPDNTNKVLWQGGAGKTYQRWNRHGTQNTYVRADQYELNRLMGTEAGRFEFYPKQIVTDPNRQSSYSIFNPSGQVVATALLGNGPNADSIPISPLENKAQPQTVTIDVLANRTQTISDGLRSAQHSFFAEGGGQNQFLYKVGIKPYFPDCGVEFIHVKGYYKIKVFDECGTVRESQTGEAGNSVINTSNAYLYGSGAPLIDNLDPDKYIVSKELYFPDTTMQRLASVFTDSHTGIGQCYIYQDSFIRRTVEAATLPCTPADTISPCDIRRAQMKAELWPGAKYGKYVKDANGQFASGVANSIFTSIQVTAPQPPTYSCGPCTVTQPAAEIGDPPPYNGQQRTVPCSCGIPHHCQYSTGSGWSCANVGMHTGELIPGTPGTYKYRYQWDCMSLPQISFPHPTIPNLYFLGSASAAPPQALVDRFSDAIAEDLLPLHPEYCKLLLCEDDLDTRIGNVETYAQAQALGLTTLASILSADPLCKNHHASAPLTATQLSYFAFDLTSLMSGSGNQNLLRRLDTFSLEQAYCGCDGPEVYVYCKTTEYATQINNMQMVNDEIKDLYIRKLINNYLANRNLLKQRMYDSANSCGPCPDVRMALIDTPVFPVIFTPSGSVAADPMLPSWMQTLMQQGMNGTQFTGIPADVQNAYNQGILDQKRDQVKQIMKGLVNCGLSVTDSTTVATALFNQSQSTSPEITPDVVKAALLSINPSILNDLCSPFLSEYGLYSEWKRKDKSKYTNKKAAFYTDLQAFLNRAEIKSALNSAASSTSYPLNISSSNPFEKELGTVLGLLNGGMINASASFVSINEGGYLNGSTLVPQKYLRLVLSNVGIRDTIYLANRKTNATGCNDKTVNPMDYATSSFSFGNIHSVLDDPAIYAPAEGYIADNLVFANLIISQASPAVSICSPYNIWSHTIPMLKKRDPEALDDCINCVQIKNAVSSYYTDVATYSLPDFTNHPLYEDALSNYLNYKLKKNHTYEEYEKLMKGCALSNSIHFKKAKGDYELVFSTEAAANNFINSLNSGIGDIDISYYLIKWANGNHIVWLDLNSIPKGKLRQVRNFIQSYAPAPTFQSGFQSTLFLGVIVRTGSCTPPWSTIAAGATINTYPIQLKSADGAWVPYTYYYITGNAAGNAESTVNLITSVKNYLNDPANSCVVSTIREAREVMRSSDYNNPVKQSYLNYVYSLAGQSQDDISEKIAPTYLQANAGITAITNASKVSYMATWCNNVKEDLYYYTASGTHPGLTRLSAVVDKVKLQFGNALFPAATTTTITPGTLGRALKVFKMADGGVWYRLFNPENKLYNVYLYPSTKMVGTPNTYQMTAGSLNVIPGADSIYRFSVQMQKNISGNIHYVTCYGYTDFTIDTGKKLQNVVLFDHQNKRGCVDTVNCERQVLFTAVEQGKLLHAAYIDSIKEAHFLAMRIHFPTKAVDTLLLTSQKMQYQYTLYYYDRAGNLTRTVPPVGVDTLPSATILTVDNARDAVNYNMAYVPQHKKVSKYKYNAMDQLIWQETPDAGITEFFYDAAGRLVFSQNAKQKPARQYSYTLFDNQGRISETGAITFSTTEYAAGSAHPNLVVNSGMLQMPAIIPAVRVKPRQDVVATFYDNPLLNLANEGLSAQENVRKRVSTIIHASFIAQGDTVENYYDYASHFSYDAIGNVSTLVQDNPYLQYMGQRFKRIDYDYDLLSGKVNMVSYNRGKADQFYQKYDYDADNRIITVLSSNDGLIWDRDAAYTYYKHGPLAQMRIGDLNVQSVQYAYTIQGWLKAINGDILRPEDDMGKDGQTGLYPKDVFAHALDYHYGDYKPIGSTPVTLTGPVPKSLYNGNIARQTTAIAGMDNLQRNYQYDQLNRLKSADYMKVSNDVNHAVTAMANGFKNTYNYDQDGNIKTLLRKSEAGTNIDSLTYYYPDPLKNRLGYVTDAIAGSPSNDLPSGQVAQNYQYDAIGNLVKDNQGQIDTVYWDLYGKVSTMEMGNENLRIHYDYDGMGNRVRKDVFKVDNNDTIRTSDVYVRDAAGNILAVYKDKAKITDQLTIEWVNNDIINDHGGWTTPSGTGITPFINNFYGNNGQFSVSLMNYGLEVAPTWSNNMSLSLSLNQFLQVSDGIYSQAVNMPVGTYFDPLVDANVSLVATTFEGGGHKGFEALLAALIDVPSDRDGRRMGTLDLLNNMVPDVPLALLNSYGINGANIPPPSRPSVLSDQINNRGVGDFINRYKDVASSFGMIDFYREIARNKGLVDNGWISSNLRLQTELQRSFNNYAPRAEAADFFGQWLITQDPNWLVNHTSGEERLHIVYQQAPTEFLNGYLDNIGIQGVNHALHDIPQLTVGSYLHDVLTAVLTGSLNPTYTPPDVNTPDPANIKGDTLYLAEHHLYGSSRLGIKTYNSQLCRNVYSPMNGSTPAGLTDSTLSKKEPWYSQGYAHWIKADKTSPYTGSTFNMSRDTIWETRTLGSKCYEMTDHLGNVLAVVMDRKSGYGSTNGLYNGFYANLASVSDYYPGGFGMKERAKAFEEFEFGYNGQMKTDEVYGKGNLNTAKFWEMDTRILRRWNLDPVVKPGLSDYSVFANSPILLADPDGLDSINVTRNVQTWTNSDGSLGGRQDERMAIIKKEGKDVFTFTLNSGITYKDGSSTASSTTQILHLGSGAFESSYGTGHTLWLDGLFSTDRKMTAEETVGSWMNSNSTFKNYMLSRNKKSDMYAVSATFNDVAHKVLPIIVGAAAGGFGSLLKVGSSAEAGNAFKHNFKYANRVRMRAVEDPVSHNFPYSFDDFILGTRPIPQKNGYNIFQLSGEMNGKNGVFEIGLTKDGIIDHRFFRPAKK